MRRDQPSTRPQREGFATISRYSPSFYMHQGRYSLSQEREAFRVAATHAEPASMQGRCYSGPSADASPCPATCCIFAGCSTSNHGHAFGTQPLLERSCQERATEPSSRVQQTHRFEEERTTKRAMFSTLHYFVGGSTSNKETKKRKRSSSSNDNQGPHYGPTASTTQRWRYFEDAQQQQLQQQQDNDDESREIRRRAFPGHYGDEEPPPPALPLSSDPAGVPQWEGHLSIGAGLRYRNMRNSSEHTGLWR
ncbi:hypothetical protein QOT17_015231 [Balamuthia mandrillaris]